MYNQMNFVFNHSDKLEALGTQYYELLFKTGVIANRMTENYTQGLKAGEKGAGGYLVPDSMEAQIVQTLAEENVMRRLATVIHMEDGERAVPVVRSMSDAQWLDENEAMEMGTAGFEAARLKPRKLGIDVFFEEQNIHSMSGDGELMLTILASYAQEESRSVSENCKWRIRKRFEAGELVNWRFMYGYRITKGHVEIEPDEAAIVRWVFQSYLDGLGSTEIARVLREGNVPCLNGGMWTANRVTHLLKNEKYAGNALLQKKFVDDHIHKREKNNLGQLPKYYAEGTHPAIISPETFAQACALRERNRQANGIERDAPQYSVFTQMILCDKCGKYYRRKVSRTETAWNCSTYLTMGKAHCHTKQVPEDILMKNAAAVLGLTQFDEAVFRNQIQEIRVPCFNHLVFVFKDGRHEERIWQDKSRASSWTDEMRTQAAENARRRFEGARSATKRAQIGDLCRCTQRLLKEGDGR